MPHTSRKKRPSIPASKRLQVTDDNGWTHVTSGSNVRRVMRTAHGTSLKSPSSTSGKELGKELDGEAYNDHQDKGTTAPILKPAEAPARLTFDELQSQYAIHREKWASSETWRRLRTRLERWVCERYQSVGDEENLDLSSRSIAGPVDAIVCIGLGSMSGFLRDGWVDRRSVSMYQLAALESIVGLLSYQPQETATSITSTTPIPLSIPIYAQDPVFNTHDISLLQSLGIKPLPSPKAFNLITHNTLLFCPGAEKQHLELILSSRPCVVLGGPLEDTGSAVIQRFLERDVAESVRLVGFEECEHAFWRVGAYFRRDLEGENERFGVMC